MFKYEKAMIVDADAEAVYRLVSKIDAYHFVEIEVCSAANTAWTKLSGLSTHASIQVLFVNVETIPDAGRLISKIMASPELSHINVIALSFDTPGASLEQLVALGVSGYLRKSHNEADLRRVLSQLKRRQQKVV